MKLLLIILMLVIFEVNGGIFDRLTGLKADSERISTLKSKDLFSNCTLEPRACTPHEGSRVDGTCNNYNYPTRGSARGPYLRLLTPDYGNNKKSIRLNKNGKPLPSARKVRTALQSTGRVDDKRMFNVAAAHFLQFIHRDVSILDGSRDYLQRRQYCCLPEGKSDPRCEPITVPSDDPYLKVTDIHCLNFSRSRTFQDVGCANEIDYPEQINYQTPLLDLSTIYGVDEEALHNVREYEHGLLRMENRDGRYVPLANLTDYNRNATLRDYEPCFQNKANESTCYRFGFPEVGNYDLRTTTFTIFFMREHNRLAAALHKINPCWKDDRLFKMARQINIATASSIFMYELLPSLLGQSNMLHYGLISNQVEHVTAYDETVVPLVYAEYEIAMKYYNTLLDGRIKRYGEKFHYVGEFSLSDTLYRPALIEQDTNFEEINRGTFTQYASKIDDILDPEISQKFYGEIVKAHDLGAIDIQTGRDLGVRGYNDYRHLCGLKAAKKFEDFIDVMEIEKIEALKQLYEDISDVDLLAGIISENLIKGTFVTPTLFCIIAKQLQVFRFGDRFWFERGDQMHSFNIAQLHEIRKTSMARIVCDNVEAFKSIQPLALLNVGPRNSPVPCSSISSLDLTKWQDHSCIDYRNGYDHNKYKETYQSSRPQSMYMKQEWPSKQSQVSQQSEYSGKQGMESRNMDYVAFFDSLLSMAEVKRKEYRV